MQPLAALLAYSGNEDRIPFSKKFHQSRFMTLTTPILSSNSQGILQAQHTSIDYYRFVQTERKVTRLLPFFDFS